MKHPMPGGPDSPEAFIFSTSPGACSVCAPLHWPAARVAQFAEASMGISGLTSVDPQKMFGQTSGFKRSPHPCPDAPTLRQHWLLMQEAPVCARGQKMTCSVSAGRQSITFHPCGYTSTHPYDIDNLYCQRCDRYMELQ